MKPTFLFYDLETSGLSPYFDQILTFAAIRTDLELNEIQRYALTLSLRPDIVPSPEAFVTHRLPPSQLDGGITEYEAAAIIHEIVNTPGTKSIGYNTLGFDDHFLRFMFYRNLLDPYRHQYANGCGRMDLLPIATLYRIFRPEPVHWPEVDGRPSMKLELISAVNRLVTSGRAHDAMTDVEATLALARRLRRDEKVWHYCLDFFDKKEDLHRQRNLPHTFKVGGSEGNNYPVALMISMEMGAASMYVAPVLGIGDAVPYGNQSLWLRLDQEVLPESGELLFEKQFAVRKKYGVSPFLLPPKDRFWNRLPLEQKMRQQESIRRNMKRIDGDEHHRKLFKDLVRYHREFEYPVVPHLDADAALYQSSFFSTQEKNEMARFHQSTLSEKLGLVESGAMPPRIREMAQRILFRNFPEDGLTPFLREKRRTYLERALRPLEESGPSGPLIGYKNDRRLTPQKALDALHRLRRGEKEEKSTLIDLDTDLGEGSSIPTHDADDKKRKETILDDEQKGLLTWLEGYLFSLMG